MVSVLNPSTFFIPLVAPVFWHSGIYNNPHYPQTRWSLGDISSKSQYSCMRGSDITLWFALLASTDFAFSEKFVISSLLSWCFAPLPWQDPSKKKPFVTMQFFQRKFAVTSLIKFYPKMWELWVHPDYNHFYILWTSKSGKLKPKTNIFSWKGQPFFY